MARRIRDHDWASTPLGPIEGWPQTLRTIVQLMLASKVMMVAPWGPDGILIYNDAYSRLIGSRSAIALGRPVWDVLPELRPVLGPQFEEVKAGRAVSISDQYYPFVRTTEIEPAWFDVSHTPVFDEQGTTAGILTALTETTTRVEAERRRGEAEDALWKSKEQQAFLLRVSDELRRLADPAAIESAASRLLVEHLGAHRAMYLEIEGTETNRVAVIRGQYARGVPLLPERVPYVDFANAFPSQLLEAHEALVVADTANDPRLSEIVRNSWLTTNVAAAIATSLIKSDRMVANFGLHSAVARKWTASEVRLVEEVADRTWAAVERSRAEQALRESEAKYRILFESIDEGFLIHEMIRDEAGRAIDFRMVEANQALTRITGLGRDTVGKRGSEFLPNLERFWLDTYDRVARTGTPERVENYNQATGRWYNVHVSKVAGEDRRVTVVFDDVTARKRAELVLQESEGRQAFLLRLSDALRSEPDAGAVADCAVRMLATQLGLDICYTATFYPTADRAEITHQFRRATPAMPAHLRLSDFPDAFRHTLDRTLIFDDIVNASELSEFDRRNIAALGMGAMISVPLRRGPMNVIWSLTAMMLQPRRWTAGEVALIEEASERTWAAIERARSDKALRESEERLRNVLNSMAEGFALFSPDFTILDVNEETLRLDGRTREQLVGRSHWEAYPATEQSALGELYRRVMSERTAGSLEYRYLWPDGRDMWVDVRAYPTSGGDIAVFWRDSTGRKRAEERLRQSELKFRALFDSIDEGFITAEVIYDCDGRPVDALYLEWNPAASRLTAGRDFDGRLFKDLVPGAESSWLETYDRVARTGTAERLERYAAPLGRWYDFHVSRVAGTEGTGKARVAIVFQDVTERKRAEDGLRKSEEQFRRAVEEAPIPVIMHAEDGQVLQISRTWTELTGFQAEDIPTFEAWLNHAYGEGANAVRRHMRDLFQGNLRTINVEFPIRTLAGETRYWSFSASSPGSLRDGRRFIVGMAVDITGRRRAEETLRQSEQRFRLLVDNVQEYALFQTDLEGKATSWNPGAERLFGYTSAEMLGRTVDVLLTPEDREQAVLAHEIQSVQRGELQRDTRWMVRKDGSRFWAQWVTEPAHDDAGELRGVVKVLRDETERKRAEERQLLMMGELNHRVKNTLATVQSIASQTLRGSPDPDQFVINFQARLHALSRAHNLLTRRSWQAADITDVVRDQLAMGGEEDRITMAGPPALLSPQSAVAVALVLHELGTNARKYGALSSPAGRISVEWATAPQEQVLVLNWTETGGPAVTPPGKRGFGTTMIEKSLGGVGGSTELRFETDGLRCTIRLPLAPNEKTPVQASEQE